MKPKVLKVCIIGPAAPPNGGMAMQGQLLKQLLQADGIEVDYLAVNFALKPKILNQLKIVRAVFRFIVYIHILWQKTKAQPVLHILANSGWSWHLFASPAIIMGKLRNCTVIVNYRGGGADTFFQRQSKFIFPILKKADKIIVPSLYLKQVFEKYELETSVVPNIIGHNIEKKNLVKPKSMNFHHSPLIFVVTRNLEEIYGVHYILEAIALLHKEYDNFILKIAGSGPCLSVLQTQCHHLGLSKKVEFCGRLEREQIQFLYESADVMINASTVDNMPNALLEALSYGVPIISTRVGGIPFMVEHMQTAILVEPKNPQAIKSALIQVIQDPKLSKRLSVNGLESAKQYTWAQIGPQWKKHYYQDYLPDVNN